MEDYDKHLEDDRELLEGSEPEETGLIYCVVVKPMKGRSEGLKWIQCLSTEGMQDFEKEKEIFLQKQKEKNIHFTQTDFIFGTIPAGQWSFSFDKAYRNFTKI